MQETTGHLGSSDSDTACPTHWDSSSAQARAETTAKGRLCVGDLSSGPALFSLVTASCLLFCYYCHLLIPQTCKVHRGVSRRLPLLCPTLWSLTLPHSQGRLNFHKLCTSCLSVSGVSHWTSGSPVPCMAAMHGRIHSFSACVALHTSFTHSPSKASGCLFTLAVVTTKCRRLLGVRFYIPGVCQAMLAHTVFLASVSEEFPLWFPSGCPNSQSHLQCWTPPPPQPNQQLPFPV